MSAHYLLTFIGTGGYRQADGAREYKTAEYDIDGKRYKTAFLAEALCKHNSFNGVIVAGTTASMWEKIYEGFGKLTGLPVEDQVFLDIGTRTEVATEKTPVNEDLDEFDQPAWLDPVRKVLPGYSSLALLEYGTTAEEQSRNIERLVTALSHVPPNGELAIDITHGFRSFPLLTLAALQALSVRKDRPFRIGAVYYGMLDVSSERGYAPVVRLDMTADYEYTGRAVYIAQAYGRFDELLTVLPKGKLRDSISDFNDAIALQRVGNAASTLERVSSAVKQIQSSKLSVTENQGVEAVKWVLRNLFEGFGESPTVSQQQYALARWYFRQRNYAASYLLLVESIVTERCLRSGGGITGKEARLEATKWLNGKGEGIRRTYKKVNHVRNRIAHATIASVADDLAGEIQLLKDSLHTSFSYFEHSY